jgi:hypothetical protein
MNAGQTLLAAVFLAPLSGCGATGPTKAVKPVYDVRTLFLNDPEKTELMGSGTAPASITWFTLHERPFLVLWSDASQVSRDAGYDPQAGIGNPKGTLDYLDRRPSRVIAFSGQIHSKDTGQFTIDHKTYDLAKGGLFLVLGKEDDVQIKQLHAEVSELTFGPRDVVTFGLADPEIKGFFARLRNPK